ncbi:MAG: hypothetical protein KME35_15685 [Aphanocapsa sp. GSE-SYN-MK-11-07L]|jgi:hypothetical protein|nr:hypothetical protein [Aphanocapsa sp. GSE-SYN-MK-11-07L]
MREQFPARLNSLISEKQSGGWVWGRLQLEFGELQPDELNAIATALGYKYGYNSLAKRMWEDDWKATKSSWESIQREKALKKVENERLNALILAKQSVQHNNQPKQSLTEVERVLISIIFRMPPEQQLQLLDAFLDRHRV